MRGALAFSLAVAGCASPPLHPPASGPVGASGTCIAAGVPAFVDPPPGDAGPPEVYGYQFNDDYAPRVAAVIERGELREVTLTPGLRGFDEDPTIRINDWTKSTGHEVTDQHVQHGRATALRVPLIVGGWVEVPVTLTWSDGKGDPQVTKVKLRVLGDSVEAAVGASRALRGDCVWGAVDRDSL